MKDLDRLEEIADLGLDSLEVDEILDGIAREAAEALDLPTGVVSIVMDEAQYFTAMFGVDGWMGATRGSPVEWSFCRNVVGSFCVQGREERSFTEQDLVVLRGFAARAMERIESRRRAPTA